MEESNNVLNLPFNEADGSTTASDYSKSRTNATVTDCAFVNGKQGKAIEFDGNGHADVNGSMINLAGDFTLLAWIKTEGNIGLLLQYGIEAEEQIQRDYTIGNTWVCLAVVKEGLTVKIYKDMLLADTITLPSQLVGMGINQPFATDNGVGCIDEVRVYDTAATPEELDTLISTAKKLTYYLNGKSFIPTWGIYVESSDGILQRPKQKARYTQDWPDMHGEVVDLTNKRVQPREITLKCWIPANGKNEFVSKWEDFIKEFDKDDTARLMIDIHPTKPLVYEVYVTDTLDVTKKWNDELMVGTFTLKLREPDPVKRVVRFRADGEHYIKLKSDKIVTVAWGDQTFTHNVWGDHTTEQTKLTHTYSTDNPIYYAVISGVIEEITDFETDGIVVWERF